MQKTKDDRRLLARLLVGFVVLLAACESSQTFSPDQQHAIDALGFVDAKPTGWAFQCSESDSLLNSTTFSAKNAQGRPVNGSICCGWIKSCTVRF